MSARPKRRPLSETVKENFAGAIKTGAYAANEQLPTEHDLAVEFAVSRPIVREVLQGLRDLGLIQSRRGAGSFVRNTGVREPIGFDPLENLGDLSQCYAFRLTVEPVAAAIAVDHQDQAMLADIEAALTEMRVATRRYRHCEGADFAFHLATAKASGNSYFATVFAALKSHIAVGMQAHGRSVKAEVGGLEQIYAEHETIFTAIKLRTARAKTLMHEHLPGSRARMIDGSKELNGPED